MSTSRNLLAAAFAIAASASAFAGPMGNEFTEAPQARSSMSRAEVQAETRAAMAQGSLERSSYDELIGVVTDRQAHRAAALARSDVRSETRAALAQGSLERSSYDEQIGVVTQRQSPIRR